MNFLLFEQISHFTPKPRRSHSYKYDKDKTRSLFDNQTSLFDWHYVLFLGSVWLIFLLYIGRAISIQVINREKYLGLAEKNRIREFYLLPSRGVIYDRWDQVIVRNKPRFGLEMNTLICREGNNIEPCLKIIDEVDKYLEFEDRPLIEEEIRNYKTNILLATGLEKDKVLVLEANISRLAGVSIETAPARDYLYSEAFAHVIGYVGLGEDLSPSVVGKTGVEEQYDQYLSGVPGNKVVQVDSPGITYRLIATKDPLPGKDVTLSLDIGLQTKAYDLLQAKVEDPKGETTGGAVVALDPLDGSVLALVSYPSFNPNKMSSGISQAELSDLSQNPNFPFFNRAIAGAYPPGSTFKLVTASAILMEGVAKVFDTIVDQGFIQIGPFIYRNWRSGEGEVNLIRALQRSNDTYFYIMGGGYGGVGGLGIKRLHDWATRFGFGRRSGIDIEGEVGGFMPDGQHREWYQGDDYISSIGQGDILATPLQISNLMSYFANGGKIYKPRIVKNIDGVGSTQSEVLVENMLEEEMYDAIRKGINSAVKSGGTAYPLFGFTSKYGIELAGKTGTSEFISSDGEEGTHAIFTAFGPYYDDENKQANLDRSTDKPIVVTVFLENGGSGSDDAAPIVNQLLEHWFSR